MVVAELARLHHAGMRMTSNTIVAAGHSGLASAIHKYVGSFERARRLAKIPSPGRRLPDVIEHWDETRVIHEIVKRHRAGESVAYKKAPTKLIDAALYYCGSWKEAIEMAGLDYESIRRSSPAWDRTRILAALRSSAKSPRRGVGRDGAIDPALSLAAGRAFGTLRAALAAARLSPNDLLRRTRLSDEELATALRRVLRQQPNMTRGDLNRSPLGRVLKRRFRTAARGLRQLGIEWTPAPPRRRAQRPVHSGRDQ